MANVYTAGSDRRLIIYSISRYIFLRTAYIDGIERPIMLASDFLDGLSDVGLGDTIYYAYQNQNGDILVKNEQRSTFSCEKQREPRYALSTACSK